MSYREKARTVIRVGTTDIFKLNQRYRVEDIWNLLQVPQEDRTNAWLSGLHEYNGCIYALCTGRPFDSKCLHISQNSHLFLGEVWWEGGQASKLDGSLLRLLTVDRFTVHVFFAEYFELGFRYLGRGLLRGMDHSPASVRWEIDSNNGMICLREHCNELRRFLLFHLDHFLWPFNGGLEDDPLMQAIGQLELAAAIERVEVDTLRFGEGVHWDSGVAHYESIRSDLLSDVAAVLTTFIYVWMALDTILGLFPLPKVPKHMKNGAKGIDSAIYYLKQQLGYHNADEAMPCYSSLLEVLRQVVSSMARYRDLHNEFCLQPHMNEWGLGIHVIRKLRNRFFHGGLQMPEPDEWSGDESKDVLLFELSTRLTLITIQLLLSRECSRRNILLQEAWMSLKEGDPAAEALRRMHLRNP